MKKRKKAKAKTVALSANAWAWKFLALNRDGTKATDRWLLCCWAEPSKESLAARGRPTTDAVAVRVTFREVPARKKRRRA